MIFYQFMPQDFIEAEERVSKLPILTYALLSGAVRLNVHLTNMPVLIGDVNMSDVIKNASKHLQTTLKDIHSEKLGSSHAHAAISAALGYKSKKALLTDNHNIPIDDEFILYKQNSAINTEVLNIAVESMNNSPLKDLPRYAMERAVTEALTPECECCGKKTRHSVPLFSSDDIDDPIAQVCGACRTNEREYAYCTYCGYDTLYRANEVNAAGECYEHRGEGSLSDEEQEDWDSYSEYLSK